MSVDARDEKDIYGGNYPKSRALAIKRSGGKCQFCGMRRARDGHHWAYPKSNYPSGEKVQAHDLTALCKPCHVFVTILRTWVDEENADFNSLAGDLEDANNFYEKRRAFSFWFFPEGQTPEEMTPEEEVSKRTTSEEETPKEKPLESEVLENTSSRSNDNPPYKVSERKSPLGEEGYVPPRSANFRSGGQSISHAKNNRQSTIGNSGWLLVVTIVIGAGIAVLYTAMFVQ